MSVVVIIILAIIALAIILGLLACFFPVSYDVKGAGENTDIEISGKARWLFGTLSMSFTIVGQDLYYVFRLFGIPFKKGKTEEALLKVIPGSEETDEKTEVKTAPEAELTELIAESVQETLEDETEAEETILQIIAATVAKAKKAYEKYEKIRHLFETKAGKRTWAYFKDKAKVLLKIIKPYIIKGQIVYGFDDAAVTAMAFAFFANRAYMIGGDDLEVIPNFMEEGFEMDVVMKGKLPPLKTMKAVSDIVSDEGIQKLYRAIGRILNG